MNSPLHNQTDNTPASFHIEARGVSSNERIPSDGETSSPQTGNQNPHDDGNHETPNGVNISAPNEDHEGKKELKFVYMLGGQIIATGIAGFSLKNTSNVSGEVKILRSILLGFMYLSLISLFYSLCLYAYKSSSQGVWVGRVDRVVRVISYVAMAFTLLIATGFNLSDKLMLPVTLVVCILCFPAIILYAIKIA